MVCVCVCVCVQGGKGSKVFASRVLVVGQLVMYLTGYRDYLTCFHELFLTFINVTLVSKCQARSLALDQSVHIVNTTGT